MTVIKKLFERKFKSIHSETLLVLALFIFNIILIYPKLMPEFNEINPHDGAKYIESGRMLFIWGLRQLSWGPLVAFIYAPIHLFVWKSLDWFMIEAWVGNFIMFSLIWFSFYYLSRQIRNLISPFILISIMIVSTFFFPVLENQSDAVFLALSAFALAKLINYYYHKNIKYLWFSSVFVSLGVLARVETILLIGTLLIFGLIIGRKRYSFVKIVVACIVPTLAILLLFVAINMLTFGTSNLGIRSKSYDSFQWNQSVLSDGDLNKAYQESDQLFGSKEENQESIIRAIIRNPKAILKRIPANLVNLPEMYLSIFGRVQGYLLLLFCAWGFCALIKKKEAMLLIILLTWPLHSLIALIFLARHIIPQTSYLFLILGSIGIYAFYGSETKLNHKLILLLLVLITVLFSTIDNRPKLLIGSALLFISILIDLLIKSKENKNNTLRIIPLIFLLYIGITFRTPYSFPKKLIGVSQDELAVKYLEVTLPKQSNVWSFVPAPAVAAKMNSFDLRTITRSINNSDKFIEYIKENDIKAIFLENYYHPQSRELAEQYINNNLTYFTHSYESNDGRINIYLVNND